MSQPQVTILMPMYNAEVFVERALRSLLQEQRVALEVIVIDHQSRDRSPALVQAVGDPRLRLVTHQGGGIADVLNTGLGLARGEFIARCDADDLYPPDRLAAQLAWLEQHPEFAAVAGNYAAIDPRGRPLISFQCGDQETDITEELRAGVTRTHLGTFLIRTQALHQLGGFRAYFTTAEDLDLQLRLGDRYRVGYCPQVTYYYRIHRYSITHRVASRQREFFDQMAQGFQRQRQDIGSDDLDRGDPPEVPGKSGPRRGASRHIQGFLIARAWQELDQGELCQASWTGLQAGLRAPLEGLAWRSILVLWLKAWQRQGRRG
ncbi:MAG: glycosyltransferase family 2 protein [Cyanobacteria bacterium REEB459]|nr:glycosyltransferase family 2 protein [Cyanobacteria bacterium REEB459]